MPAKVRKIKLRDVHCEKGYNDMRYLLLPLEKERLRKYCSLWKKRFGHAAALDNNAIFHLGDDPDSRCVWSASGQVPRFRRSMGILWHCATNTVVTGKERLAIMGWPIFPELATYIKTEVPMHIATLPCKKLSNYAGNSYHMAMAGVFQFVTLACTRFSER